MEKEEFFDIDNIINVKNKEIDKNIKKEELIDEEEKKEDIINIQNNENTYKIKNQPLIGDKRENIT